MVIHGRRGPMKLHLHLFFNILASTQFYSYQQQSGIIQWNNWDLEGDLKFDGLLRLINDEQFLL